MQAMKIEKVVCPVCKGENIRKNGIILRRKGRFQRYQCVNPSCPQYGFMWKGEKVTEAGDYADQKAPVKK